MNNAAQTPDWLNVSDDATEVPFDFEGFTDEEKAKITAEIAAATGTPWLQDTKKDESEDTKETPAYNVKAEEDAVLARFMAKDPDAINDPVLRGMAFRAYLRYQGKHGKLNNRFGEDAKV